MEEVVIHGLLAIVAAYDAIVILLFVKLIVLALADAYEDWAYHNTTKPIHFMNWRKNPGPSGALVHYGVIGHGYPVDSGPIDESKYLPSEIGFRQWLWSTNKRRLLSPFMRTEWIGSELHADNWDDSQEIRGVGGIHAIRAPLNWMEQVNDYHPVLGTMKAMVHLPPEEGHDGDILIPVRGLCERFGKFQLGTVGWRSEWAIIRKIVAPTAQIGFEIERIYPDVEVIYVQGKASSST